MIVKLLLLWARIPWRVKQAGLGILAILVVAVVIFALGSHKGAENVRAETAKANAHAIAASEKAGARVANAAEASGQRTRQTEARIAGALSQSLEALRAAAATDDLARVDAAIDAGIDRVWHAAGFEAGAAAPRLDDPGSRGADHRLPGAFQT